MLTRLCGIFFLFTGVLSAQIPVRVPVQVPAQVPVQMPVQIPVPACYFQLASTFFPYPLVAQALSSHRVTQDRWGIIFNDLQARSPGIPQLLIARANTLTPNPLQPYDSVAAGALMRVVLEEVYTQSLMANYITDPYIIHTSFNFIRDQQAFRVRACLGEGPMVNQPVTE